MAPSASEQPKATSNFVSAETELPLALAAGRLPTLGKRRVPFWRGYL